MEIEAPKVQSLSEIMDELAPSTKMQEDVINQQKSGLEQKYAGQQQQLEAKKVKGFNDINTSATGRGMSFSGIPLDEQANYLSTEYLPKMAQLEYQKNEEGMAFDRELADLFSQRYGLAYNSRVNQENNLFNWNSQLQNQGWQSGENKLDRDWRTGERIAGQLYNTSEREAGQRYGTSEREASQIWTAGQNQVDRDWRTGERIAGQGFTTSERLASQNFSARQNQLEREFNSKENAANRAATAALNAPQGFTSGEIKSSVDNIVKTQGLGADGYMRPSKWRSGYSTFFAETGEGPEMYSALMAGFVNPVSADEYRL